MSNFQAALKSLAADHLSPAEVSKRINELLYANIPRHKFFTAFYAVVNIPERTFVPVRRLTIFPNRSYSSIKQSLVKCGNVAILNLAGAGF